MGSRSDPGNIMSYSGSASSPAKSHNVPVIDLSNVHLTLPSVAGPVEILRGVDFQVMPGETVALIGPSGSGKSTIMAVCAGLERPSSGRVLVGGHDLADLNEDQLALFRRGQIGIVFQSFHLIPTMSALENVAIPLELAGRRDAFDRAEAGLKRVGLGHRLTHYPAQLSGGEQQRVAIARAFAAEPKIVLADEPTGNLDGATGAAVMDLLFDAELRKDTTILLITHDANLAHQCDRILRLRDGQLEENSHPAHLKLAEA